MEPIAFLEKLRARGKVPGALLFYGPPGAGKTERALKFSKGLLCMKDKTWGCGECISCREMESVEERILKGEWEEITVAEESFLYLAGEHPDFIFIPPSGDSVRIDQIRALGEFALKKPALSQRKVILMDEAHRMTRESANALLKTLEEPPAHTHFILTGSKDALLPTILSRTYGVSFPPLSRKTFAEVTGKDKAHLYDLVLGDVKLAKELGEKEHLLGFVKELMSRDTKKVLGVVEKVDKLDVQDRLLFVYLLERSLVEAFLKGTLGYDKFELASGRLSRLREGVGKGVKLGPALLVLHNLWRSSDGLHKGKEL